LKVPARASRRGFFRLLASGFLLSALLLGALPYLEVNYPPTTSGPFASLTRVSGPPIVSIEVDLPGVLDERDVKISPSDPLWIAFSEGGRVFFSEGQLLEGQTLGFDIEVEGFVPAGEYPVVFETFDIEGQAGSVSATWTVQVNYRLQIYSIFLGQRRLLQRLLTIALPLLAIGAFMTYRMTPTILPMMFSLGFKEKLMLGGQAAIGILPFGMILGKIANAAKAARALIKAGKAAQAGRKAAKAAKSAAKAARQAAKKTAQTAPKASKAAAKAGKAASKAAKGADDAAKAADDAAKAAESAAERAADAQNLANKAEAVDQGAGRLTPSRATKSARDAAKRAQETAETFKKRAEDAMEQAGKAAENAIDKAEKAAQAAEDAVKAAIAWYETGGIIIAGLFGWDASWKLGENLADALDKGGFLG
jgi:hypothetical protein